MWTISPRDLQSLRGGGGEPFTKFVDALVRSHSFRHGIPDSAIATTVHVNVPDGGVDTRVDEGSKEDATGWLRCPTAWQYKAVDSATMTENSVCQEIQKRYASDLVKRGYGYRLCVCDEFTAEKKEKLQNALDRTAKSLNPGAYACYILSASDLTEWANHVPGIVGSIFERPVSIARHWQAWESSETAITPEYVVPPGWQERLAAIQSHIQFAVPPADPILTVQGSAGVGKTRLVFEAIRHTAGAHQLVVVTNDEKQAQEAAHWLVNQGRLAILVGDECSVQGRVALRTILQGSESRIRAIAIDNTGEPPQAGAPGIWLEKIPVPSAEKILEENFPMVPRERRRAYADLSGGYIRLAADLCKYDAEMHSAGSFAPAITRLEDYYRTRISQEDQRAVEAAALLHRVGCEDDVAEQLECLAQLTDVDPTSVREAARCLKDAPGFLASTPRYVYVTPQIIAEIAFHRAWRRWAGPNREGFLDRIPELLRSSFELRVRGLADQEVRSFVSAHFRKRAADLVPTDLADEAKVEGLLGLLETDPTAYLPQLEKLIRQASHEELLAIRGSEFGGKGVRRRIVWTAERLASFPEYFPAAELILRKLAIAETEPGIGNNATGIWRQLFRVYLPGTAVPFLDRLPTLRARVLSTDSKERDLALGALDRLMDTHVTRMSSPSLVGGKIPPADWAPRNQGEWEACLSAGMSLIEELLDKEDALASAAWNYLIGHLRALLSWGQLDCLRSILEKQRLPESLLAAWLEQIDDYLRYECGEGGNLGPAFVEYCQKVKAWQKELNPKHFAGRLRSIVGKDVWHHGIRENVYGEGSEIEPLADEILANPSLLESIVDYLCSEEARSASLLGSILGQKDPRATFLDVILTASRQSKSAAFVGGYVAGVLKSSPAQQSLINETIDRLEPDDPELAAEIIVAGLEVTDPIKRLVRLVASRKLHPGYLQYLHYGNVLTDASDGQFTAALRVLAPPECPLVQLKRAIEFIGQRLKARAARGEPVVAEHEETLPSIKRILERGSTLHDGSGFWWKEALLSLSEVDPEWAASVAASAMGGEDFDKRNYSTSILAKIAAIAPDTVMKVVGDAILDPDRGWRWLIGPRRAVFTSLPVGVVLDWLRGAGLEGARAIAYHLPSPSVTADGKPLVPELTEQVLSAYGADEQVLETFSTGQHNMQVFWGEISSHYEGHARTARAFLDHPVRPIRKWAEKELASSEAAAAEWRKKEEDEHYEL